MFMAPDENITLITYLRRSVFPAITVAVFYINYLWLVPHRLMKHHDRRSFWLCNIMMVCLLTGALSFWSGYIHRLHVAEEQASGIRTLPPPPTDSSIEGFIIFGFVRDFYHLSMAVALATALRMSRRWLELDKRNKEAEVALREAELNNLRSQINPHFLLNTLNNIYALIAFNQDKAQKAVLHLSKMLRHILYDTSQVINLDNEVDFLHNYIDIMKIRMPENVEVKEHFDIPSPCRIQIASMIIISLVENAFKHGISPTAPSFVHVSLVANEEQIVCEISNSYYPKSSKDQSGHGIGLQQVRSRLDLMYPDHYEWENGPTPDNQQYISKLTIHDTKLHYH